MLNSKADAAKVLQGAIETICLICTDGLTEAQLALYEGDKEIWFSEIQFNPN